MAWVIEMDKCVLGDVGRSCFRGVMGTQTLAESSLLVLDAPKPNAARIAVDR